MHICVTPNACMIIGMRFQSSSSTAPEADGVIHFVVELTMQSDTVITVQVCTKETAPVSAEGLLMLRFSIV